jgi:hypothetical protein
LCDDDDDNNNNNNSNKVNSTNCDVPDYIITSIQANSINFPVTQDILGHMNSLNEFEDRMIKKHLTPDANQAL